MKERRTVYDETIVLYTNNQHVTNEDRDRAMRVMLETGKPVIMRARVGFLRRMFARIFGE